MHCNFDLDMGQLTIVANSAGICTWIHFRRRHRTQCWPWPLVAFTNESKNFESTRELE